MTTHPHPLPEVSLRRAEDAWLADATARLRLVRRRTTPRPTPTDPEENDV